MPRLCSICTDKRLLQVNQARFVEGQSVPAIAARFNLAERTLKRHFSHVVPEGLPRDLLAVPHRPAQIGRPCATCAHKKAGEINKALVLGTSINSLERTYKITAESLTRHRAECIAEYMERARVKLTAGTILEQIEGLRCEIDEFLQKARVEDDLKAWGVAIQRAERSIALLAQVTSRLEGDEETFLRSRFWAALCEAHAKALAPFPEAAAALKVELGQVFA